jgi:hypothetical protein
LQHALGAVGEEDCVDRGVNAARRVEVEVLGDGVGIKRIFKEWG